MNERSLKRYFFPGVTLPDHPERGRLLYQFKDVHRVEVVLDIEDAVLRHVVLQDKLKVDRIGLEDTSVTFLPLDGVASLDVFGSCVVNPERVRNDVRLGQGLQ